MTVPRAAETLPTQIIVTIALDVLAMEPWSDDRLHPASIACIIFMDIAVLHDLFLVIFESDVWGGGRGVKGVPDGFFRTYTGYFLGFIKIT